MKSRDQIKRVLIYRLGSLGDTVVALPSLHLVARAFPQAERLLLTNRPVHAKAPAASEVLGNSGLVHGYINYPIGTRDPRQLIALWWKILSFRPQVLVYLAKSRGEHAIRRDATFFKACGVSHIIGLPIGELAQPLYDPERGLWESESARLLRSLRGLGEIDLDDRRSWDMSLTISEHEAALRALAPIGRRKFLVCGPGTKMQAKDWGRENWQRLLSKLRHRFPEHALVLIGASDEKDYCEHVASGWHNHVLNCCGRLSPRESAALLTRAELFLGPDSGPMHLAAAAGVPCAIAFAARTMPGIWYPWGLGNQIVYHAVNCMGCDIETCIENKKKCLTSITVEEMFNAAVAAWAYGTKSIEEGKVSRD
jgi:heptosyltransferase-3